MNKNNFCNNCGKQGHLFHQCILPITSYGIIAFKCGMEGIEYLMIRRKDSYGYIDFMRGKYSTHNLNHLLSLVNEMSIDEKDRILTQPFEKLWNEMWGNVNNGNSHHKNEEMISKTRFETLREGIPTGIDDKVITIKDIIQMSKTLWKETEWEFPKGRRNNKEKDLDCALREFEEETGIKSSELNIIENVLPFEELFFGSNHKFYKNKYFLAYMNNFQEENNKLSNFQITEVSKIEWKTCQKCLETIRPYNLEKKELITNINKVLQEYRLYS